MLLLQLKISVILHSIEFEILPLQNFDRDLSENLGEFLAGEIAEISVRSRRDLGEISKSWRPKTRRDLGEISKSRPDSRRDLGKIVKSRQPKTRRDSRRDLKISWRFSLRFSPRSENLVEILAEISKSWRPKTPRESRQDFK